MVFLILTNLRIAEIRFAAAHFRQARRIKNLLCNEQQFHPFAKSRREGLEHRIQIVAQRNACRFRVLQLRIIVNGSKLYFCPGQKVGYGFYIRSAFIRHNRCTQRRTQRHLFLRDTQVSIRKKCSKTGIRCKVDLHFLCQIFF